MFDNSSVEKGWRMRQDQIGGAGTGGGGGPGADDGVTGPRFDPHKWV